MKKRSELLEDAADYIEEHGWTQGNYHNHDTGEVCAVGALMEVDFQSDSAIWDTVKWLERFTEGRAVIDWNDKPERKPQEVLDFLRNAAKEAARDEQE